ncbi:hypothetical protein OHA44_17095 [Streptomyces sp. NBC_00144]|uniref:hypothetical protein n=1 Tax=Streptomyces sp. NBC_00144 TaxID=2975665 RepID=UPI003252DEB1
MAEDAPTETPAAVSEAPEADAEPTSPNAEAAKWRTKFRDAESRIATAEARVSALLRTQVEAMVADRIAVPADLWDIANVALADVCDEDGSISTDAVSDAVKAALEERPGLARPAEPVWMSIDGRSDPEMAQQPITFGDALRYRHRR